MGKLAYRFTTQISFSESVRSHSFLLRCTPMHLPFQKVIDEKCTVFPAADLQRGTDSFGNIVHTGYIEEPHASFAFTSEGLLSLDTYRICEELNPVFVHASHYTHPSGLLSELFAQAGVVPGDAVALNVERISETLSRHFLYESGVTGVSTTAHEALELGKGVCQDFAHLTIALCRMARIPARYVAGFMQGEVYTHAWIEFFDAGIWLPFDPTHHRRATDGYVKLSHGRDFADCAIERGVFNGITYQNLAVSLNVHSIDQ